MLDELLEQRHRTKRNCVQSRVVRLTWLMYDEGYRSEDFVFLFYKLNHHRGRYLLNETTGLSLHHTRSLFDMCYISNTSALY